MKNYILLAAITSIVAIPAIFADTTGTGTTTSTGTTSTGVVTGTGTTGTGTTGTGLSCMTGGIIQLDILAAQEAYIRELSRLITEKKTSYIAAQVLTGSARVDVLKASNEKFRTGIKAAQKTLKSLKETYKKQKMECKKSDREHDKDRNHKNINSIIKKLEKKNHDNNSRGRGHGNDR